MGISLGEGPHRKWSRRLKVGWIWRIEDYGDQGFLRVAAEQRGAGQGGFLREKRPQSLRGNRWTNSAEAGGNSEAELPSFLFYGTGSETVE